MKTKLFITSTVLFGIALMTNFTSCDSGKKEILGKTWKYISYTLEKKAKNIPDVPPPPPPPPPIGIDRPFRKNALINDIIVMADLGTPFFKIDTDGKFSVYVQTTTPLLSGKITTLEDKKFYLISYNEVSNIDDFEIVKITKEELIIKFEDKDNEEILSATFKAAE